MRNAFAVYIREIKSYFLSPIFYIIATVFIFVIGNSFKDNFFRFATRTMQSLRMVQNYGGVLPVMNINIEVVHNLFAFMNFIFLLIVPLLTMRLYAEEKKTGTMELLMTSPITTVQVLLGKFFSCLTIYFFMMILTVAFIGIMIIQSRGFIDLGIVFSSYLGSILYGSAIIAIGMFFSSITENQIIAATVSLTFVLGLWIVIVSAQYIAPPFNIFIRFLALPDHLDSFIYGFIETKHIAYFLSMTFFWLFLTAISVESARWRQ